MNKLKVYLSGATLNTDDSFQSWRTRCQMLRQNGYYTNLDFVDPLSYFDYKHKLPQTNKQCLDFFMWQIDKCDALLINLDYSNVSVGSGMEVEHAYCHNVPIIAFGSKPDTWYNWTKERTTVILNDLDEAIEYIHNYYAKVVN